MDLAWLLMFLIILKASTLALDVELCCFLTAMAMSVLMDIVLGMIIILVMVELGLRLGCLMWVVVLLVLMAMAIGVLVFLVREMRHIILRFGTVNFRNLWGVMDKVKGVLGGGFLEMYFDSILFVIRRFVSRLMMASSTVLRRVCLMVLWVGVWYHFVGYVEVCFFAVCSG